MPRQVVTLQWTREHKSEIENLHMPDGKRVRPACDISYVQYHGGPHGQTPLGEFGWAARAGGERRLFGDDMRSARTWVELTAKGEIETMCDGLAEVRFQEDQTHVRK